MLPSPTNMAEIAAMANAAEEAEKNDGGLDLESINASSSSRSSHGRRKKKGNKRAHRRSQALDSHDSSSNLDFLNELEIPEKKNSTRGLRNRANMMPSSYEQPAWMNYKQKRGEGGMSRKSSKREGKRGDRSPGNRSSPRRINSYVGDGTESKVGTPRNKLASPLSAGVASDGTNSPSPKRGGRGTKRNSRAAGMGSPSHGDSMPPAAAGAMTPRGSTPTRDSSHRKKGSRRRHKEKVKSSAGLKSQTLPKKQAASFPSINGTRSVANLLSPQSAQDQHLTMRAVGVKKKQHQKPVSMTRKYATRSNTTSSDAFLSLSPTRSVKTVKTGFT